MFGISKHYSNKSIIAPQTCFNNCLSAYKKSDYLREFGNITQSNHTYFQKSIAVQCWGL